MEKLEFAEPRSGHAHENATLQMEHLLGTLGENVVRIVMLHADSGYSDAEIAAMMGESRTKIAKILSRVREKLRKVRDTGGRSDAKDSAWGNRPDAITEVAKQRTDGGLAGGPDAKE